MKSLDDLGEFQLRAMDAAECIAMGFEPAKMIQAGIEHSFEAKGIWYDDRLILVWGHMPLGLVGEVTEAWLLSTTAADDYRLRYAYWSKKMLEQLQAEYPKIRISVLKAYTESVAWLDWLGFKAVGRFIMNDNEFYVMERERA